MTDNKDYLNTDLPFSDRARDLVSRMTLDEKVSQMMHDSPPIERLGVPAYNWWNECLHGVARAGVATVFPQAIGMAAMWDAELMYGIADVISTEGRAKHHEALRQGDRGVFRGITFFTPNINIFRDPRWGRGHETYGEDPYLTGRLGVAFVKGIQGDDPKHLKGVATAKHYAVHSGPEPARHTFDARVSPKDLRETYLAAFEACVREGKVESIMGAYNRTDGEPCCASKKLLIDILRGEWGFDGFVVSDLGAIPDIHDHHHFTNNVYESVALAVKNGCDFECGWVYGSLKEAVEQGLISEAEIDVALTRVFTARMKLGMFDPPENVSYASIPYEVNDCEEHRQLARKAARESIVLLKNDRRLLPLSKDLESIAVVGPNADSEDVLLGNYYGTPSRYVTLLQGIRNAVSPSTRVWYAQGCELTGDSTWGFSEAVSAAERANVVIVCVGLSPQLEGEEGDASKSEANGDRVTLHIPAIQQKLLERMVAVGKPVVLALTTGSAVSINWANENVPAIVNVWYPGEEGGTALADVLFGDYNPSGRLPVTFPKSVDQLPPFEDYSMVGRTYRYMTEEPLYPFGYGLSYTTFEYFDLKLSSAQLAAGDDLKVTVRVRNSGAYAGDEVVQMYLSDLEASVRVPVRSLVGFTRVSLEPGAAQEVSFTITSEQMRIVNDAGERVLEPGKFRVEVGGWAGKPAVVGEFGVS